VSREGWLRLAVVVAFVAALEALCRFGIIPKTVLIPPSEMAVSLWQILRSGEFDADILFTLRNVVASAVISIALGFTVGVLIHMLPRVRRSIEPLLASYYAVPTFMFYPVFIIIFGVGGVAITAIAVLLAIVAMITATLNGLDRIPPVLRKTARMFRMNLPARALLLDLPAAAPYLFTGVKLSVAYAFIGVIASEFILSGSGIGYSIAYAYNNFNNRTMYGLMLLVIVSAVVINGALDIVDRRLQARLRRA
jgi:NitT/TauT family transport system permease protein